jgi:flagellar motor switch/type III secretory pathway protein FliN
MPELNPQLAESILTACRGNADEIAAALGRALDQPFTVAVGEAAPLAADGLPEAFGVPGLAVVFILGSGGALLLLPETGGLLPDWCVEPDATGQSKLTTLAQELGMLVLPDECMPDDFKAGRVKNLTGALKRGGLGDAATAVTIELTAGEKHQTAQLIWPIATPAMVLGAATAKAEPKAPPATPEAAAPPPAAPPPAAPPPAAPAAKAPSPVSIGAAAPAMAKPALPARRITRPEELPDYTRSLLKIKVPVVVTLAEQRQPLRRIVELGPGSIIQFDKSCEEMLDLEVGTHRIAAGEAVKVGDKFGLRITAIILPDERFSSVKPPAPAAAGPPRNR